MERDTAKYFEDEITVINDVDDPRKVPYDELNPDMYKDNWVYDHKTKIFVDAQHVGGHWRGILYILTVVFNIREDEEKLEEFYSEMVYNQYPHWFDVDTANKYIEENIEMKGQDWWTRNHIDEVTKNTKEHKAKWAK